MKITKATLKSFIRKNKDNLFIRVKSSFDSMTDGCTDREREFKNAISTQEYNDHTLGIKGAWMVGSSRDYFNSYNDEQFMGIEVNNCCGCFIVAIRK